MLAFFFFRCPRPPHLAGFNFPTPVCGLQARRLHVFVRMRRGGPLLTGNPTYAEVNIADDSSVAALQDAVASKLMLSSPPDTVQLMNGTQN